MARSRQEALSALLRAAGPLRGIADELDHFPQEPGPGETLELTRSTAAGVLARYLIGDLTATAVTDWARLIEPRFDVVPERAARAEVARLLYELANQSIGEPLTPAYAQKWIRRLGHEPPRSMFG